VVGEVYYGFWFQVSGFSIDTVDTFDSMDSMDSMEIDKLLNS
tara:strand:- start:160 stop:285 length:126 start_codon:yes stop_codon:yes gene_type:complete